MDKKSTTNRLAWFAASLLIIGTTPGTEVAAATLDNQLRNSRSATDFFRITCSRNDQGDTRQLRVTVFDRSPDINALISAQVIRGLSGRNITDTNKGDSQPSPAITLVGGNGIYEVRVNKTGRGVKNYQLDCRCLTSTGQRAGMAVTTVQNQ